MAEITERSICIHAADSRVHYLTFARESQSGHVNQFSVTLGATDEDWGEFFSKEDAALLYFWLGKQLGEVV